MEGRYRRCRGDIAGGEQQSQVKGSDSTCQWRGDIAGDRRSSGTLVPYDIIVSPTISWIDL